MGRRRSPGALGAPWRALSHDFGACGLPSMPHLSKPWQLDLPRLALSNEVRNFFWVLKMTDVDLKVGIFFAARAFRRCAGPFNHFQSSGLIAPPLPLSRRSPPCS